MAKESKAKEEQNGMKTALVGVRKAGEMGEGSRLYQ